MFWEMVTSSTNTPSSPESSQHRSASKWETLGCFASLCPQELCLLGKVDFADVHGFVVQALAGVLVELGALGRAVHNDNDPSPGCTEEGFQIGQSYRAGAAHEEARCPVWSCDRHPDAEPEPSPMEWIAVPTETIACGVRAGPAAKRQSRLRRRLRFQRGIPIAPGPPPPARCSWGESPGL